VKNSIPHTGDRDSLKPDLFWENVPGKAILCFAAHMGVDYR